MSPLTLSLRLPNLVPLRLSPSQLRPKNLRIKVQVSPLGVALTGLAAYPCGAPMRRAAGQSSQRRGFYSEDLKSDMRLPAMS